jgi:hypothetical protein
MEEDRRDEELDESELEDVDAEELPAREALSVVDVGESLGPPPLAD